MVGGQQAPPQPTQMSEQEMMRQQEMIMIRQGQEEKMAIAEAQNQNGVYVRVPFDRLNNVYTGQNDLVSMIMCNDDKCNVIQNLRTNGINIPYSKDQKIYIDPRTAHNLWPQLY